MGALVIRRQKIQFKMAFLMALDVIRYTMGFFYGPFLSLYFFKESADSVVPLSIYNALSLGIAGATPLILGFVLKGRHRMTMLRAGVIMNFFYVLYIILMRERIVDHFEILAFLYGISTAMYFFPHNMLSSEIVGRKQRGNYELVKRSLIYAAGVLVPFLMGLTITLTDFQVAAIGTLGLSVAQIILLFLIKAPSEKEVKFRPILAVRKFWRERTVRSQFRVSFLQGLTTSISAMQVLLPILIFNSFRTDLDFGVISSVTNLVLILVSVMYLKIPKPRENRWFPICFALIPLAGLLLYLTVANDYTLVGYYVAYNLMIGLLQLVCLIKSYNVAKLKSIGKEQAAEYWALRDFFQGAGRATSHVLLLAAGLLGGWWMYGLLIFLTVMLWPLERAMRRIEV